MSSGPWRRKLTDCWLFTYQCETASNTWNRQTYDGLSTRTELIFFITCKLYASMPGDCVIVILLWIRFDKIWSSTSTDKVSKRVYLYRFLKHWNQAENVEILTVLSPTCSQRKCGFRNSNYITLWLIAFTVFICSEQSAISYFLFHKCVSLWFL